MKKQHVYSVAFASSLLVFFCLLLTGGYRLVGHTVDCGDTVQSIPANLTGMICAAPRMAEQTEASVPQQERMQHAALCADSVVRELPCSAVCSDANGNVLGEKSYLRAVYQAFSLGDGFV